MNEQRGLQVTDNNERINSVAPLANVARLTELIDRCLNRAPGLPGMGCFHGRAGLGKTTAGIYGTNKFNACHVEAMPIGGVKGLLTMIVAELGLKPAKTSLGLFDQAAQELAISERPLIIDEADKILYEAQIELVRRLHDVSQAPVILMGEEALPQMLQRWDRVHSRILSWVGAEAATADDVEHLTRIYALGVQLGPELKAALLAASNGSIRNVATNLAHIREYALTRGLKKVDLADWGKTMFHTGVAPSPRGPGVVHLPQRRRA